MAFDPNHDYPLGARRPELVTTPGGLPLNDVTLGRCAKVASPETRSAPRRETLRLQADVARAAGRRQLAESFERAAELASVPDELLLEVYTALRPRRATAAELEEWALRLEGHERHADRSLRARGGLDLRRARAPRRWVASASRHAHGAT